MAVCQTCIRFQSSRLSPETSTPASFLSTKTVPTPTSRRPWLPVRAELSGLGHSVVAQSIVVHTLVAPELEPIMEVFGKQSSRFSDVLGSISSLYSEVGEERRAAAEYVQRTAEEGGRSAEDYGRRALLFERSGEMAASSKMKGERVLEELEILEGEVLEHDKGRAAADYLRRAQIFSKSAEIFGSQHSEEVIT